MSSASSNHQSDTTVCAHGSLVYAVQTQSVGSRISAGSCPSPSRARRHMRLRDGTEATIGEACADGGITTCSRIAYDAHRYGQ